jgi:hypothetical protein
MQWVDEKGNGMIGEERRRKEQRGDEVRFRILSRAQIWRNRYLGEYRMRERKESRIKERKKKKSEERNEDEKK